jgi:AraC family transcriptional regulator
MLMDRLNVMKIAINYIENHLAGEIDYRELERLVGYSLHHFQRIFCVVTDFTLGEYISRNRMTTAAFEL